MKTLIGEFPDEISEIDVWAINIESDKDWNKVIGSPLTRDSGRSFVLKSSRILGMQDDKFAYGYGEVLKGFMERQFPNHINPGHNKLNQYSQAHNSANLFQVNNVIPDYSGIFTIAA